MPTVLRIGPFRFFFYSNEGTEPPHIHVEAGDNVAKFWLSPVALAKNAGFSRTDVRKIEHHVNDHVSELLEAWHGYFGN